MYRPSLYFYVSKKKKNLCDAFTLIKVTWRSIQGKNVVNTGIRIRNGFVSIEEVIVNSCDLILTVYISY